MAVWFSSLYWKCIKTNQLPTHQLYHSQKQIQVNIALRADFARAEVLLFSVLRAIRF